MTNLLADISLSPKGGFFGFGPLGLEGSNPTNAAGIFTRIISNTIGLMTIIAIIWFLILVIVGAYNLMTAGSDKGRLENARQSILTAVIGLVVVISAVFFLELIGYLLGIPDIRYLESFIKTLNP